MTPVTVQSLAADARALFSVLPGDQDGELVRDGVRVWTVADKANRPDWIQPMCHAAHGDMLPDDWRYSFIVEALDFLAEADADDDPDALRERFHDEVGPDIYTHELTSWLGSRADRAGYCDEAAEEYGLEGGDTVQRLGLGQVAERGEVFEAVLAFLVDLADEQNAELEDEDEESEDGDDA